MKTTIGKARHETIPLFITDMQDRLLANAEIIILSDYCHNHCAHHKPFQACHECPAFSVELGGYIACDGYLQVQPYAMREERGHGEH